ETDAPTLQIVWRHFDDHTITDASADTELPHLASRVGQDFVIIVELHPEVAIREHLSDGAVELQQFFFRHPNLQLPQLGRWPAFGSGSPGRCINLTFPNWFGSPFAEP